MNAWLGFIAEMNGIGDVPALQTVENAPSALLPSGNVPTRWNCWMFQVSTSMRSRPGTVPAWAVPAWASRDAARMDASGRIGLHMAGSPLTGRRRRGFPAANRRLQTGHDPKRTVKTTQRRLGCSARTRRPAASAERGRHGLDAGKPAPSSNSVAREALGAPLGLLARTPECTLDRAA